MTLQDIQVFMCLLCILVSYHFKLLNLYMLDLKYIFLGKFNRNILNFFLNCVLFLKTDVTQTGSLSQCWLITAAASLNIAVKTSVVVADKLMGGVIAALDFLFFSCWKLLIVQMTSGFNSRDYY